MTVRMDIDPRALVWARENHGMDLHALATAVNTPPAIVAAWENGEKRPTYKQMRKVAKKLDQGLPFFLVPPPRDKELPETVDYRRRGGPVSPALAREIVRTERYRQTVLTYEGPPSRRLDLRPLTMPTVEQRAREFREWLPAPREDHPYGHDPLRLLNEWRELLATAGILVFQASRIPPEEFRGLSVYHSELPIILINGADANRAKLFTLLHEVGHLINRTSGLCLLEDKQVDEPLANAFAAAVLLPADAVLTAAKQAESEGVDMVEVIAKQRGVSRLACAIRLHHLGLVDRKVVDEIRDLTEAAWKRHREELRARKGGPPYWRVRYRDLGQTFIGVIARALEAGTIDWVEAIALTNTKGPTLDRLLNEYHGQ